MGKQKHRFKFGRLKVLALAVAGANALITGVNHQSAMSAQLERQEELLGEQYALQHELDYHAHELEYIGSDEYFEQEARERLGWVHEDEILYIDSSSSQPPREKVSAEPTPTPSVPGPRRTEKPSSIASSSAVRSASAEPEPSASPSSEKSEEVSSTPERTPRPSSTPKSIG